jgi:hypothetical protein
MLYEVVDFLLLIGSNSTPMHVLVLKLRKIGSVLCVRLVFPRAINRS